MISLISLIEVENVHKRRPVLPINLFILSPQAPQPGFGSITLLQKFTPISKSWIRDRISHAFAYSSKTVTRSIYSISSRLFISTPATVAQPANSFSCLVIDAFDLRIPAFKFSTYIKDSPTECSSLSTMFTLAFHSKFTRISSDKFLSLYQKSTITTTNVAQRATNLIQR